MSISRAPGIANVVALALVCSAALAGSAALAAPRILIILPGQTFQPGVGIVGSPDPVVLRERIPIRVVVVDEEANLDPSYAGRLYIPIVPANLPGQGPPV